MLSIIISTKDRPEPLQELINSIRRYTEDYELVIHDDAIGESIPVATAWNKCAEKAKGEYLVFLNDDMLVTKDWASIMIDDMKKFPYIGCLAFRVYDDEGNIQSRGHSFNGEQPYLPVFNDSLDALFNVDYSDHPFTTKSIWERVGGFTAHGHMYYEDADFGLKIQSINKMVMYEPKAILHHQTIGLRTGSAKDKERRSYNESVLQKQSKVSFYKKWGKYLNERS